MLLITIFIIFFVKHSECDCVQRSDRQLEVKLHNDIFNKTYKLYTPPNKNLTAVAITFIPKNFKFDKNEKVFAFYSWISLEWDDPRIQWNTSEYEGISETTVNTFNIWTPIGALTNKDVKGVGHSYTLPAKYCQVHYKGQLNCFLQIFHQTTCNTNLEDWPHDSQTCTFHLGVDERFKDNVVFTTNKKRIIVYLTTEYGPGWQIVDCAVKENDLDAVKFNVTFVVQRHGTGLAALVTFPLFIIGTMTVSAMFLDVRKGTRLSFLTLSLYSHFKFLQTINEKIPHHGSNSPTILFYIKASIVVTIFLIILTLVLNSITKRTWRSYLWIDLVNAYVLKSRMRYVILPKWTVSKMENAPSHVKTWTDFACIVNSCFIFIFVIIYVYIYYDCIPQPQYK